jgi:hypothetical protein
MQPWHRIAQLMGAVLLAAFALVDVLPQPASAQQAALPSAIADAIRTDVATRVGVQPSQVVIARVEAVTWRDGCMGIYLPNALCTLALVPGYVVWATSGSAGYRYHTDRTATALFAADGIPAASIPTAPLPEGVIEEDGSGTIIAGKVPLQGGFGLIVFGGGTYTQLLTASGCPPATARFWATDAAGRFVLLVPIAEVAAVNAPFEAMFGGTIPAGTPLIGTCPPPVALTGVQGTVTEGPIQPVCYEGISCERPYSALLIVIDAAGQQVASATSSAIDGSFRISLDPGSYTLVPEDKPGPLPVASPVDFMVKAGEFTTVDISYDTGIR